MRFIAHRGVFDGNYTNENTMVQVQLALDKGFDVECDIRVVNGTYFLGHDDAIEEVKKELLRDDRFWCHAKDGQTLSSLIDDGCHAFFHQDDDYTLTSRSIVWVYLKKAFTA